MVYSFCTISDIVKITLDQMENSGCYFQSEWKTGIAKHWSLQNVFLQSALTSWVDTLLTKVSTCDLSEIHLHF